MTVQDETTTTDGILLSDAAAGKVKTLLEQEGREDLALRVAVQPGGDHVEEFFRLYGDSDGDGDVDVLDLESFSSTLGLTDQDEGFLWYFDFDGDGDVDEEVDLVEFQRRLVLEP